MDSKQIDRCRRNENENLIFARSSFGWIRSHGPRRLSRLLGFLHRRYWCVASDVETDVVRALDEGIKIKFWPLSIHTYGQKRASFMLCRRCPSRPSITIFAVFVISFSSFLLFSMKPCWGRFVWRLTVSARGIKPVIISRVILELIKKVLDVPLNPKRKYNRVKTWKSRNNTCSVNVWWLSVSWSDNVS